MREEVTAKRAPSAQLVRGSGSVLRRSRAARCSSGRAARGLAALALVAWVVLMPRTSAAQQKSFYLDRLYMAGQPDDAIAMWRPHMGKETRFFGQFGLGFALNPFRIENHIDDPR